MSKHDSIEESITKWKWVSISLLILLLIVSAYRLSVYANRFSLREIALSNPFEPNLGSEQIDQQYPHATSVKALRDEHNLDTLILGPEFNSGTIRNFLTEYLYPTIITANSSHLIMQRTEASPGNCKELDSRGSVVLYVCNH